MIGNIQGMGSMTPMRPMGGPPPAKELTDEEKQQVEDILSEYDPENLTTEDAEAMFKAFEEAGIKGPGLREAIEEAGFDPEEVWSLAHDGQEQPRGPRPEQSNSINSTTLQTLQSILSQFDLTSSTSLTSTQTEDLLSQLSEAGLLRNGNLIDLSA